MGHTDEFIAIFEALSEQRRKAVIVWFALMKDFPALFPRPQQFDDLPLSRVIGLLEFLTDEITHAQ